MRFLRQGSLLSVVVGAGVFLTATTWSYGHNPTSYSDPICWQDPTIYCGNEYGLYEGHPELSQCVNDIQWIQWTDPDCVDD